MYTYLHIHTYIGFSVVGLILTESSFIYVPQCISLNYIEKIPPRLDLTYSW